MEEFACFSPWGRDPSSYLQTSVSSFLPVPPPPPPPLLYLVPKLPSSASASQWHLDQERAFPWIIGLFWEPDILPRITRFGEHIGLLSSPAPWISFTFFYIYHSISSPLYQMSVMILYSFYSCFHFTRFILKVSNGQFLNCGTLWRCLLTVPQIYTSIG